MIMMVDVDDVMARVGLASGSGRRFRHLFTLMGLLFVHYNSIFLFETSC